MTPLRNSTLPHSKTLLNAGVVCSLLALSALPIIAAPTPSPTAVASEMVRRGEMIYREGLLPSGEAVQAFVKGDIKVPGSSFTCVSCHQRSGLGSVEGRVFTPPTNADKLFQPFHFLFKGIAQDPKLLFPIPPRRPAYSDVTLADVIRGGIDPNGRLLNDVMPRYLLENEEMADLIAYLKTLSAEFSPGVTDNSIRFATVISDDVSPKDRKAMLDPLQRYVDIKNGQVRFFKTKAGTRSLLMAENMMPSRELALRTISLTPWLLKGKPDTWRKQLEEYNRKEPVFALVGGITTGEWEPVHRFSEENRIPCLFPLTDFPVLSEKDWYTLYLSKGYYQEGEGAARYLNRMDEKLKGKGILQIVRDSREGKALAAGFEETWLELGHDKPFAITLKQGKDASEALRSLPPMQGKPAAIILWDGTAALPALEALANSGNRPEMVMLSSSYLGENIWSIKESLRDFTYLTYPYRLSQPPQDKTLPPKEKSAPPQMAKKEFADGTGRIANQTYSIKEVLSMALMDMSGNYYRDNFLDVIGMIMDQEVPLYERLSFGPGQRYASKGCYIVQLAKGEKREMIKRSDWAIY